MRLFHSRFAILDEFASLFSTTSNAPIFAIDLSRKVKGMKIGSELLQRLSDRDFGTQLLELRPGFPESIQ